MGMTVYGFIVSECTINKRHFGITCSNDCCSGITLHDPNKKGDLCAHTNRNIYNHCCLTAWVHKIQVILYIKIQIYSFPMLDNPYISYLDRDNPKY